MDFHKLKARFDETRQYKDRWLGLYKDLYYYVIPDRDAFNVKFNYKDDGKPTTMQVWDNTAVIAAYQRANDLHSLLLPKDRVWGKWMLDPHVFPQEFIEQSKPLVDEINDNIFFYINQSNLARIVSSSNLDLVGGTGALWVESIDDDTPLYFRSIPAVALYIEYSTDDVLNTCWYQVKMTGRQVEEAFPDYRGGKLEALRGAPNEQFMVYYGQIKLTEKKFYIYAVLEDDPFWPLWEAERAYPQVIIYRDRVRPGEADGRGVGIDLLPTIRDLNRVVMYDRQNLAFKANPPMFYDADAYFNPYSVRQWAGAMFARQPQGRNPIEALTMPDYPQVLPHIQDLRDVILRAFQVDPLGEINNPVKSATEVSIRENRAQRTASTDISRLINELPRQVFDVSAKILGERRLLTRDRSVAALNTKKMSFVFQSPLYDLQKQDNLNHFITNMQLKQQFIGQEAAMASIDLAEVQEWLTDQLNLPSKLFKTKKGMMEIITQLAQAAQQAALPAPSTAAVKPSTPGLPEVKI